MIDATAFSELTPRMIEQVFAFALDLGLKSLVLCAAALLLDRLLVRRVLARSTALNASLLGLILLPAAAFFFPEMSLNLPSQQAVAESAPAAVQSDVQTSAFAERKEAALSPFAPPTELASRSETRRFETLEVQHAAASPLAPRVIDWRGMSLLAYAVVAAGMLLRLILSLAAIARLRRSGAPLAEPAWTERLEHWRARLGVARPVALLATDRIDVPVVVGWRRPAIMAPERLASADRNTIDAVLLHELAHVRRGDYGWNLLLRVGLAIYWPNLLAQLIGRTVARVREQACDDACIHWLGGAESYRATLVALASHLLHRPLAALGMAMARISRLERRLAQIDASRGRADCQARRAWRYTAMAVVLAAAGVLGALRFAAAPAMANEPLKPVTDADDAKKQPPTTPATTEPEPPQPAAASKEELPPDPNEVHAKPAEKEAGQDVAEAPQEPIKVRVEKVRREDFIVQTTQPGTLQPARSMELYARVAGLIVARQVNVGDRVTAGQVLAEINAPELEAELEQATADAAEAPIAVEQAQGKLDAVTAGLEGAQAEEAKCEADLEQATSELELAEKKYRRALNAANALTQSAIDEKESQLQNAKGFVGVAKARPASAKTKIKHAEATVAVAKAGLRIAELHSAAAVKRQQRLEQQAALRNIAAPADGVISQEAAEPGSFVGPGGKPLFVISSTNRVMTMQTNIPERDALAVAVGQHAQIWLDSDPEAAPREAQVLRVGYALDPASRTLPVEIALENKDGRLLSGMYGRVTIDLETHRDVLTTSGWAFRYDNNGFSRCYRVVDGRAVETEVIAVGNSTDRKEIKGGLSQGDVIIVEVLQSETKSRKPKNGARVEIIEDAK